jgi:chromosome segregation ATPase
VPTEEISSVRSQLELSEQTCAELKRSLAFVKEELHQKGSEVESAMQKVASMQETIDVLHSELGAEATCAIDG